MGSATALTSIVDAVANSATATTKRGSAGLASIASSGPERIFHIQAPIPCPYGCTVMSAILRIYQAGAASSGSRTLSARRITQGWQESQLDYKNRPARSSTPAASTVVSGAGSDGRVIDFDLTAEVQVFSDRAAVNYGWTIESNNTNLITIYTSEGPSAYKPRLIVTWSDRPETPTDLTPGGGGLVATPTPVLRWAFVDHGGDTTMSGFQVHLKGTNTGWTSAGGFASPGLDTGIVDATQPQYDMTGSGYTGLGSSGSMYWTVRNRDGAGLWSDWSDPTLVTYQVQQTVTLDSPGPTVHDTTFPWAWTCADQALVQLMIRDTSGNVLWSSGRIANSALRAYTQPRGIIRKPGVTYKAVLRVWDSLNRMDVPGYPAYVEVTQDLVYSDDGTVDPPAHVEFEPFPAGRPGGTLSWTRVEMPDQFAVWVDGVEYAVDAAASFLVSGTGYALDLLDLTPRTDHDVTVKAIVIDGAATAASEAAAAITVRTDPVGVWLIDPLDPSLDVVMFEEDSAGGIVNTDLPEVTTVFTPDGSSRSVPVTSALRWFEGSVSSGILTDTDTTDGEGGGEATTAGEYRRRLLVMKGNRLRDYRLIWGTHVVPVYLSNVNAQYVDVAAERYAVSFDFVAAVASPEYTLS